MAESCMHGILFDHGRTARIGLPEAVFSERKSREALLELMQNYGLNKERPVLFTRLAPDIFFSFPEDLQRQYHFHAL